MDKNGFSDPFVKFLMNGSELCKSDTKKKNLNPVWNQNFAVKPGLDKTWRLLFLKYKSMSIQLVHKITLRNAV